MVMQEAHAVSAAFAFSKHDQSSTSLICRYVYLAVCMDVPPAAKPAASSILLQPADYRDSATTLMRPHASAA